MTCLRRRPFVPANGRRYKCGVLRLDGMSLVGFSDLETTAEIIMQDNCSVCIFWLCECFEPFELLTEVAVVSVGCCYVSARLLLKLIEMVDNDSDQGRVRREVMQARVEHCKPPEQVHTHTSAICSCAHTVIFAIVDAICERRWCMRDNPASS